MIVPGALHNRIHLNQNVLQVQEAPAVRLVFQPILVGPNDMPIPDHGQVL
jgi:hypothetical protein